MKTAWERDVAFGYVVTIAFIISRPGHVGAIFEYSPAKCAALLPSTYDQL